MFGLCGLCLSEYLKLKQKYLEYYSFITLHVNINNIVLLKITIFSKTKIFSEKRGIVLNFCNLYNI